MPNTKSAKKDLRRSEKRRVQSQSIKSALKTYVKKTRSAASTGDADKSTEALRLAMKALDKAVQNGFIHKNQAARRKSRLVRRTAAASDKS
jgi:small subunit ribosomal protein S20